MRRSNPRRDADHATLLESLEPRIVLAGYAPEEVVLLELVNDARANPQVEAARLGIDLTEGLTEAEAALIGEKAPLAFNEALLAAARAHVADMNAQEYLDFLNPAGQDSQDRANAAGFTGLVTESLAGDLGEPGDVYAAWLGNSNFRKSLLSLSEVFDEDFRPSAFGAGRVLAPADSDGPFDSYWSAVVGAPTGDDPTHLLGVAYEDANGNGRYDADEGLGGVTISVVDPTSPLLVLFNATTEATGYYQLALPDGTYDVTFADPVTGAELTQSVTIAGDNVRASVTGEEINGRIEPETPSGRVARLGAHYDLERQLVIGSRAGDGDPFFYQQALGGGWAGREVASLLEGETLLSEFTTFVDPKDGRSYASVSSSNGLLLFTNNGGTWTKRNLTQELGARNITSELTSFVDQQRNAYIAGLDARNDLVLYVQTRNQSVDGDFQWDFRNLAEDDLRANGLAMPRFTGELISYVTSWNALTIAGLDDNGDIQTVWTADTLDNWTTSNLSAITGARGFVGGLTAYLTSWNGINVGGVNERGEAVIAWWVPSFRGDWQQANLTTAFDGPELMASTVSSYVTSWGGLNVAGLSADGSSVEVYWWAPGLTNWNVTRLSSFIDDAPIPAGPITGVTSDRGQTSLIGATAEGDVVRYFWQPGAAWAAENVTDLFTG
ncbi:MAG: SdrD B-like domain-containing protein [Planctomycetota bacterium]